MERLDKGMYTIPVWFGLFFTGLKTLFLPHGPQTYFHEVVYPEWFEYTLAVPFTLAALALLVSSAVGSPLLRPDIKLSDIYWVQFVALAIIVTVIGIDIIAKDTPLFQLFTLGGGFGAIIQIGCIRYMAHLWVEIKKLQTQ